MRKTETSAETARPRGVRRPWRVPRAAINALAREIAEHFHPHRIILFGSYAYGKPTSDSDVDLLVVMPAKNETTQAARIRVAIDCDFPLDVLVRTPKTLRWRLKEGDWFLREIVARGKILYEKTHRRVGAKGGGRLADRSPGNGR